MPVIALKCPVYFGNSGGTADSFALRVMLSGRFYYQKKVIAMDQCRINFSILYQPGSVSVAMPNKV